MSLSLQHQQVSPSLVPDLLGGYEGLDDSLLTPPEYLDYPKPSFDEQLSLADCGGLIDASYEDVLGPDWLTQSMALHTPDEQEGDISFAPANYFPPLSLNQEPSEPSTPLFTPSTPLTAHSPLSTSPEVEEVLSLFSDNSSSLDSTEFNTANEYLPFASFEDYTSPELTPVHTPLPSPVYYQPAPEPEPSPSTPAASKPRKKLSQGAKKERKRLQNKTAALRYRQKKKVEKTGSMSQLETLENRNAELKKTLSGLSNEIEYLKKLWSDVQAAKSKRC